MIRMIALDVDGTLLTSQGVLTEGTVLAIREARAKGIRVVLSTGRSIPEAVWLTRLTGCDDRAVCVGGAVLADMTDGRHLHRWDIPDQLAAPVLELLRGKGLASMVFAGEVNLLDPFSSEFYHRTYPYPAYLDTTVVTEDPAGWLAEHGQPLTKIHAQGDPTVFPPLLKALRAMPGLSLTSSGPDNFEVVADGVDKGKTLGLLAEEWGIMGEEIAAIGDSDNDLAMLRAVGYPVAMGNATEEVRRAAAFVTGSNDEEGAAQAIRRLLR